MREPASVHDAHCCAIHGCKYNDSACPVVHGYEEGIECEDCLEEKPEGGQMPQYSEKAWDMTWDPLGSRLGPCPSCFHSPCECNAKEQRISQFKLPKSNQQHRHDKYCHACGEPALYNETVDAKYCVRCNIWLENKCLDPKCEFCSKRERTPFEQMMKN